MSPTDAQQIAPLVMVIAIAVLVAWGAARLFYAAYQYLRATPLQRVRIKHAWRIGRRWKKLAPNVGLARIDENSKGRKDWQGKTLQSVTVVPKLKVFPEPWGIRAVMQTIPKVGVEEVEKAGGWLADAWNCQTVEVVRLKAGLVEIRGIVGNPLDEHEPYAWPAADEWILPLGRNPWMRLIGISLRQLSGIKIGGLPGYGKTMLMLAWMAVLAPRETVQFVVFDGKTSDPRYGDWGVAGERAIFIVGDNPEAANQRLTDIVRLIKDRPASLVEERGTHKFWKHGPTVANPLVLVFMDEVHNYSDAKGLTGKDKQIIESNQRLMQIISKEGRGVGVPGIFATQKQTGDAIPTGVRDNLEVGVCFATFTIEGAEAALGSGIRQDEPNQPTALVDKDTNVGICVVTGVPGLGGRYDRVRVGDLNEDELPGYIASFAHLRRDIIPAAAPTVVDVSAETSAGASVPLQKDAKTTTRRRRAS
ncbi:hypothetical protein ACE1OC_41575 (plasmid) [Streptomyces sp. DSM 116496]|uniref:hypothetical protein n=1 Tax=Streptomyces stoeckheimensis TaxID=3344656 RepID=UPI0038B3038F